MVPWLQAALSWIRALLRPAKAARARPDASAGVSHETHPRLLQARPQHLLPPFPLLSAASGPERP